MIKQKRPNRNPVKQLFITFPKSNVDKAQFRDVLLRFEPDYYKVCEEQHKDGSPHLHAVVRFKNKYSKAYVLKHFQCVYPDDYKRIDVEPVRSIKQALNYLSKEDPSPLESGTFVEARNPPNRVLINFAKTLGYKSIDDLKAAYEMKSNFRDMALNRLQDLAHIYGVTIEEYIDNPYLTFAEKKIYLKLFLDKAISKDDITFLAKQLNIKLD